jgi:hypothetical protein
MHVQELKKNPISVGHLDEEGHSIKLYGGKWKVSTRAKILAHGHNTCTIYMTTSNIDIVVVADMGADSKQWHLRLEHMSEKCIKVLLSKGKLPELKLVESNLCESCILRK